PNASPRHDLSRAAAGSATRAPSSGSFLGGDVFLAAAAVVLEGVADHVAHDHASDRTCGSTADDGAHAGAAALLLVAVAGLPVAWVAVGRVSGLATEGWIAMTGIAEGGVVRGAPFDGLGQPVAEQVGPVGLLGVLVGHGEAAEAVLSGAREPALLVGLQD